MLITLRVSAIIVRVPTTYRSYDCCQINYWKQTSYITRIKPQLPHSYVVNYADVKKYICIYINRNISAEGLASLLHIISSAAPCKHGAVWSEPLRRDTFLLSFFFLWSLVLKEISAIKATAAALWQKCSHLFPRMWDIWLVRLSQGCWRLILGVNPGRRSRPASSAHVVLIERTQAIHDQGCHRRRYVCCPSMLRTLVS